MSMKETAELVMNGSAKEATGKMAKGATKEVVVDIGIDLGGSNIYGVAFSADDGNVVAQDKVDTRAREGYRSVMERIGAQLERLSAATEGYSLRSVGLCIPGLVRPQENLVLKAPNLDWENVYPLKELQLNKRFAKAKFLLVNDVNAGLVGELRSYEKPPRLVVGYFCGTGIGGVVAIDGKLVVGAGGSAGEVGHIVVRFGGKKASGSIRGSLESYIGKWALNKKIRKDIKAGEKTMLKDVIRYDLKELPIKSSSLKKCYLAGDKYTIKLMQNYYCKYLGVGISQSVHLLDPELVILGGGVMEALGSHLLPYIQKYMSKYCLVAPPSLQLAKLGDLAAPYGASWLARQEA